MHDAPWITDYDRYFNLFYQCVDPEEREENEEDL
jgi:hypothetical protein